MDRNFSMGASLLFRMSGRNEVMKQAVSGRTVLLITSPLAVIRGSVTVRLEHFQKWSVKAALHAKLKFFFGFSTTTTSFYGTAVSKLYFTPFCHAAHFAVN